MTRIRIDLMLDPSTIKLINAMVINAKKISDRPKTVNRSRVLETLIQNCDPEKQLRIKLKETQIKLMAIKDNLDAVQELKRKEK